MVVLLERRSRKDLSVSRSRLGLRSDDASCQTSAGMRSIKLLSALGVLALAGSVTGCLSPVRPKSAPAPPSTAGPTAPRPVVSEGALGRVSLARSLLGSAYRYGGVTPKGFDCSGFSRYVFAEDGVHLPRTTVEQAAAGRWVPLDALAAGDLVFFSEAGSKPHHVGVVVSRAGEPLRMIHASTSRGVVETNVLAGSYWLRRLSFGRRVDESSTTAR